MRKIILLLIVAASGFCASAQVDTAAMRKYLTTHQSKTELIEKCRDHIFDAIVANDRTEAEKLMYYARTEFETDKYKALSLDEVWLLAIWLQKYQLAATEMVLDSLTIEEYKKQSNRFNYSLLPILADSLHFHNDYYRSGIENDKSLSESRRDFLLLFLKDFELPESDESTEIMNNASDEYLSQHPMSEHDAFVRNFIRYKYKDLGPTFGFGLNLGAAFNNGKLGDLLKSGFYGGTNIWLAYANIVVGLELASHYGKLRDDLDFGDATLEKGEGTSNLAVSFNAGYKIHCPYGFAATPMLGIGFFSIMPDSEAKDRNENFKNTDIDSKWGPVMTLQISYENAVTSFLEKPNGNFSKFSFYPAIRYSYRPIHIDSRNVNCQGSMHTITLGIRYEFGSIRRDF